MAANPDSGDGRRTRSQGASRDVKGKSVAADEPPHCIYLDISEDSEEFDIRAYFAEEEQRPTFGGKVGISKRSYTPLDAGGDTEEELEESVEDEGNKRGRSRGRGRGSVRSRGRPVGRSRTNKEGYEDGPASGVRGRGRGKKDMRRKLQEAEEAYLNETNRKIRRIIDHLEEEAMQEQSDPEMEDWASLLPDPGHTRGRMSLYKQSLHVYWGMKRLLAKAMEQVAVEMVELAQGMPTLKRELKNIQLTLLMQDRKMDKLVQRFKASGIEVKAETEGKPEAMKQ